MYALFREEMFEFPPATRQRAERAAIDDLGNPVVVDPDDRIVRLNDAAVDAIRVSESAALASSLDDYLDPVDDFDGDHVRATRDTVDRVYAITRTPLDDGAGRSVGNTVVLQDVTAERRREQRVGVLNRVLRHNLRNDLTVVLGNVTAATEQVEDGTAREHLEVAADEARRLAALGERAREVDATMSAAVDPDAVVTAASALEDVAGNVSSVHEDATVDVDVPADCRVVTDPDVFRVVFENLVENAISHDDGDRPHTSITASAVGPDGDASTASTVTFVVADDGPGSPSTNSTSSTPGSRRSSTGVASGSGASTGASARSEATSPSSPPLTAGRAFA